MPTLKNAKHKFLISLAYGTDLKVSKVISPKVKDIDLSELTIHLKTNKGNKGRIAIILEKIINDICNLIAGKRPSDFVFKSERGGKLSARTAQKYLKEKSAGMPF